MKFLTLDDVDVKGKVVLIRVDMNVPYNAQTGTITDSERVIAHAKTVKELSDKGAKVVVLAHQGRRGDPDFIHLNQHAHLLSEHTRKRVLYVNDVIGEKAVKAVAGLSDGEILLLDNVRFLEDEAVEKTAEEHSRSSLVKTLSPLADFFVNDAFSVAHRSHASIVGFTATLPSLAGRVMEHEIESCDKALNANRPRIFILGGVKPDDCVKIMKHMLEKEILDKSLTCGLLGQLLLVASGVNLGQPSTDRLREKNALDLVPVLEDLRGKYSEKIEYPLDVAEQVDAARVERSREELPCEGLIIDIGQRTINRYGDLLKNAGTIVVKGPAGVYEEKQFETGTRALLEQVKNSHAYTLIGGGHTSAALSSLGFSPDDFSYVSIAGGALITYLSGKDLPGLEALENARH
jgi:phosphoglycerate kinase